MIGLGMSAISDSWYSFVQNSKTVEEYQEIVNNGKIPIFRGHFLNKEDLILRKHILNIMCHFSTDWTDKNLQTPALTSGLIKMNELEEDGLVILIKNKLKVTEKGKKFVRNICMCLDARMLRNIPKTDIFSKTI